MPLSKLSPVKGPILASWRHCHYLGGLGTGKPSLARSRNAVVTLTSQQFIVQRPQPKLTRRSGRRLRQNWSDLRYIALADRGKRTLLVLATSRYGTAGIEIPCPADQLRSTIASAAPSLTLEEWSPAEASEKLKRARQGSSPLSGRESDALEGEAEEPSAPEGA